MSGLDVIIEDFEKHPQCPHGPTILFSRIIDGQKRNFYACSACRDRKQCTFFIWQDELHKFQSSTAKVTVWKDQSKKFLKNINHRKLFLQLNEIQNLPEDRRIFCQTCSQFQTEQYLNKHENHKLLIGVSNYQLRHPSEILPPLENAKTEAQFLFSKTAVEALVGILRNLNYRNVLCVGTPRLHEYIKTEVDDMNSLLLDIDDRYHNFFGPLEFVWYNAFNHHFFLPQGKNIFNDFLQSDNGENFVLVTDPPFGGRVEPLAYVLNLINKQFKSCNNINKDLPIFWIFPYFMEPQILNSLPNFCMLDYKVDYDNHPLFQGNEKGRKFGSPVRIFTNVNPSSITLPASEGYKYCKQCKKWVYKENKHCKICNSCTSKDGRTYIHCNDCKKCVKPSWNHCDTCSRCRQPNHTCGELTFEKECFHCKKAGHKKRDCPEVDQQQLFKKRKNSVTKTKFKKKCKLN